MKIASIFGDKFIILFILNIIVLYAPLEKNFPHFFFKLRISLKQIIEGAIAAKHKILLFSGFTSMFDIITPELEKRGIEYSILTGQTKVDTRIEMVDEFNKDDNKPSYRQSI